MSNHFETSVFGRVVGLKRLNVSTYGNPSWDVTIYDQHTDTRNVYRTSANVGLSYAIDNHEFRNHAHEFGLTRNGRLNGYERLSVDTDCMFCRSADQVHPKL